MSYKLSLYQRALLAWKHELELRREQALNDKRIKLRDGLRQKLLDMFGKEHEILLESEDDSEDDVFGAVVENLNFLGYRCEDGSIKIVLIEPCPRCGHQMPSKPLTRLAELGEGILQFEMVGILGNHQCQPDKL